jgi:aminotransferase
MNVETSRQRFRSQRTARFTESVIREMTRLALRHNAVNLAQGFPDFSAPEEIKRAACDAINDDVNQYAITWGARPFREAIAAKYRRWYGLHYDPEREVTVCCGSTEGMIASLLSVVNPGDEIVLFEPFYENYRPDALLCGAKTHLVTLHPPDWTFDPAELRRAFSPRTRAIILNTPNNPTGKVFTREELETIAALCHEFDALAITDEIYEHILYDGRAPHPHRHAARHARAHAPREQHEQDMVGDRLAYRLGAGSGGSQRRRAQGARLSDRGRGRSPAAGGHRGHEHGGQLL